MGYGCVNFAKTEEEIKSQDGNGTILVFSPKLVLIIFSEKSCTNSMEKIDLLYET
jgi:hypothetical protein